MKTIKITIEKSSDSFGAYAENVTGIFGAGDTVKECKQSILDAIETLKTMNNCPKFLKNDNYNIEYKFDVESLLNYYKGIISNPAFERLTGINQKQIHHYATGLRKPRATQRKKIEQGLHKLGEELLTIKL